MKNEIMSNLKIEVGIEGCTMDCIVGISISGIEPRHTNNGICGRELQIP
jgi:hypothetical protein